MRKTAPLVALLGATALALTACGGPASGGTSTPGQGVLADGKTFTTVIATDPGTLNPLTTVISVARSIDRFLYGRLIEVQDDGSVVAGLAEKWESTTTEATFTIRAGITCEDGTPLTATDVAANISYVGDPANGSPLMGLQVLPGTKAVGDDAARTVTVTSGAPDAFLLDNVGSIAIVCGNVLKDPDALAKGKGATGMFTMTEIAPNSQYTLTRRKEFTWGPGDWDPTQKGLPDKVVFRVVPNETTATNLLLSGEVNAALIVGADKKRLQTPDFFTSKLPVPAGQFVFNQNEGRTTADQKVREALVQSLDLAQLRQVLTGGEGSEPTGLVTIAPNPCRADVVKGHVLGFDEKAAAKALDDAGWKAGSDGMRAKDGKPLSLSLIYSTQLGDPGNAMAELVQSSWKKLGVNLAVRAVDGPGVSETLFSSGDWDVSAVSLTVALPSMLVPFYAGPKPPNGTNFAGVDNKAYTAAVTTAASKPGTEGCADWGTAEQALFDSTTVVPYANDNRTTFVRKATFVESDGIDPTSIRMYE